MQYDIHITYTTHFLLSLDMFWLWSLSCNPSSTEFSYDSPSKNSDDKPPAYILEPTSDASDPGWLALGVQECEVTQKKRFPSPIRSSLWI